MTKTEEAIRYNVDNNRIQVDLDNQTIYGVRGQPLKFSIVIPNPVRGIKRKGYYHINLSHPNGGKVVLVPVHRIFCYVLFGEAVFYMQTDHINGNSLDNRPENLRLVDARGNAQNQDRSTWEWHRDHRTKNMVVKYDQGWTIQQIAEEWGLSLTSVKKYLRNYGVDLTEDGKVDADNSFWQMIKNGLSYGKIARLLDMTIGGVSRRVSRTTPASKWYDLAQERMQQNQSIREEWK